MGMSVVLASGGIDSCVLTSIAQQEGKLAMLHISYQQQAQQRELDAFQAQVEHFKPEQSLVVSLPHFSQIGGSSLVDDRLAIETPSDLGGQIPRTYLSFGYPTFWSVAVGWAQAIDADQIFFGGVEDHGVKTYPAGKMDPSLTRECFYLFDQLIQHAVVPNKKLSLRTPLFDLSRREILELGRQCGSPLDLTWSCYRGGADHCLQCYRCCVRREGFAQAGIVDTVIRSR